MHSYRYCGLIACGLIAARLSKIDLIFKAKKASVELNYN
jgi:hypothetical protein